MAQVQGTTAADQERGSKRSCSRLNEEGAAAPAAPMEVEAAAAAAAVPGEKEEKSGDEGVTTIPPADP